MRQKKWVQIVSSCLATLMLAGCSTATYLTPAANNMGVEHLTAASLKQKNVSYEVKGLVHCERWSSTMYWKQRPDLMTQAMDEFNGHAAMMGADAVVDVQTKAENHYQFAVVVFFMPFIFGHEEAHVSGTAIKLNR